MNLDRLDLGIAEDGTAIGSALTAALNRLRGVESKSRIIILMTDGQNNAGKIPPMTAAEAADALEVKVYTIGVGTKGMAPFPQKDPFGRTVFVQAKVDIDEQTLKEVAQKTGGKYYRADNTEAFKEIYAEIDRLEKTEVEMKQYTRHEELAAWFLIPALSLCFWSSFFSIPCGGNCHDERGGFRLEQVNILWLMILSVPCLCLFLWYAWQRKKELIQMFVKSACWLH